MEEIIATTEGLKEALSLSNEILDDIELSTKALSNIALKTSRLARLIGDFDYQNIFFYEASGYPATLDGVSPDIFELAKIAGRVNNVKDGNGYKEKATLNSLEQLQYELEAAQNSITSSQDPNNSISSSNTKQYVWSPQGNKAERQELRNIISKKSKLISNRRAFIYKYVSSVYYEIKYSDISSDIFSRIRQKVDTSIVEIIPDSVKKFSAIHENLKSNNTEDWSNAVHSCRRILENTADALYPARDDKEINGKKIKLGKSNYINRLVAYVEENSLSKRFQEIVGSHMKYLGNRLDSIFQAAQKGSHDIINSQDEADRYVIYTYLVIGDILRLTQNIK